MAASSPSTSVSAYGVRTTSSSITVPSRRIGSSSSAGALGVVAVDDDRDLDRRLGPAREGVREVHHGGEVVGRGAQVVRPPRSTPSASEAGNVILPWKTSVVGAP